MSSRVAILYTRNNLQSRTKFTLLKNIVGIQSGWIKTIIWEDSLIFMWIKMSHQKHRRFTESIQYFRYALRPICQNKFLSPTSFLIFFMLSCKSYQEMWRFVFICVRVRRVAATRCSLRMLVGAELRAPAAWRTAIDVKKKLDWIYAGDWAVRHAATRRGTL